MSGVEELFGLSGRVAVVTGASSGLGVGFAHALAQAGALEVFDEPRGSLLRSLVGHLLVAAQKGMAPDAREATPRSSDAFTDPRARWRGPLPSPGS